MLATLVALAISLPVDTPRYTVEFRVLRVPAGRALVHQPDGHNYYRLGCFKEDSAYLLSTTGPRFKDIRLDSRVDAWQAPRVRMCELAGPKLRVGRTPVTERLTDAVWTTRTQNEEPCFHSAWFPDHITSREVLSAKTAFTACVTATDDGRVELRIGYSDEALPPPTKGDPVHLSSLVSPFDTAHAPASQSPLSAFSRQPQRGRESGAYVKRVMDVGDTLMASAGRVAVRPLNSNNDLLDHVPHLLRLSGTVGEEDVIVFATVRE